MCKVLIGFYTTLLRQGMVVVGLPNAFAGQIGGSEMHDGLPFGASTISVGEGERMPSESELAGARCQAAHVARIALKLRG
jgi:NAD(P)H dehydrogenase (quinone)